ncbi:MAG: glycine--tRNA ligase subunit beta [Gammaproteobacteria bacterium]|nr:glycine--tRNA ligase subunit beta [Gammaproteobacteria bacterium]
MATARPPRRADLLVEIGTEELPPRDLQKLGKAFAARFAEGLAAAGVADGAAAGDGAAHHYFATPRRLAVLVKNVAARAPSRSIERRGPALQAAFDAAGQPTQAARGFAKSCGVEVAQLATLKTDKGEWLAYRRRESGAPLAIIVIAGLDDAVRRLPAAKRMRWGSGDAEFVRPAHWLLVLHGKRVVAAEALGLKAGRLTRGHRFHAGDAPLSIADAGDYARRLESDGRVIADFARRRRVIAAQLARLAKAAGARAPHDDELLDEVTGLVEWPRAVVGEFDRRFLKLPAEVLSACMREHQKFFPLAGARGKLLPAFIAVSNLAARPGARVRAGYERVLRARLADAEFFWHSDLKTPLQSRVEALKGIRFHHRLGTLHDKAQRVAAFAVHIAGRFDGAVAAGESAADTESGTVADAGADGDTAAESTVADAGADGDTAAESTVADAGRAAWLCKADLATDMVGEFPALQGVIGRHYARQAGENPGVADAIAQHYWPRFAGDRLPQGAPAQCVALADRLDSLLGLFACGDVPSGDKDPFALRRAALGVLRILIEKRLDLDVHELLSAGAQAFGSTGATGAGVQPDAATVERVFVFLLERLPAHYAPLGFNALEVASVLACKPRRPLDFDRRLRALSRFFRNRPAAAQALAAANKRIAGILSKSAGRDGDAAAGADAGAVETVAATVDPALFQHPAEAELARQLEARGARAAGCFSAGDYSAGLTELSRLKQPIDAFFDAVLVMEKDPRLRANRLALLRRIRALFLGVADISLMQADA